MATSTCPKCPSTDFEMKILTPDGADFELMAVQCSACGAVVGITDSFKLSAMIQKQNKVLAMLASSHGWYVDLD